MTMFTAWWQLDDSLMTAWFKLGTILTMIFHFSTTVIIALIITKSNTITKIGASYTKFGQTKTWDRIGWIRGKARYSLRKAINFEQRILRLWGTFSPLRNLAQWKETDRILERVATAWEQRLRRFPSAWSTLSTPSFASVHISNSVLRALQVGATPSLGLPSTACSIARTSSTFVHINCIGSHAAHFKHTLAGQRAQHQTLHNTCSTEFHRSQAGSRHLAASSRQVPTHWPHTITLACTQLHRHTQYTHTHTHKYTNTQSGKYTLSSAKIHKSQICIIMHYIGVYCLQLLWAQILNSLRMCCPEAMWLFQA